MTLNRSSSHAAQMACQKTKSPRSECLLEMTDSAVWAGARRTNAKAGEELTGRDLGQIKLELRGKDNILTNSEIPWFSQSVS